MARTLYDDNNEYQVYPDKITCTIFPIGWKNQIFQSNQYRIGIVSVLLSISAVLRQSETGLLICVDLMRIRIQHFFSLRIRIPDPGSGSRV
jgi:hypothetical protein